MEEIYLILKEHFLINEYPLEILGIVSTLYLKKYGFELYISNNSKISSLLKTWSGDVIAWNFNYSKSKLDLPKVRKIINQGIRFFAITYDDELYSWGDNSYYSLGLGKIKQKSITIPTRVDILNVKDIIYGPFYIIALTTNGDIYSWGQISRLESCSKPNKINLTNVDKICCGDKYTIALTKSNEIYSWRSNCSTLEPQKIEFKEKVKTIICKQSHKYLITESNDLYSFGKDMNQRKVLLSNVKQIICGNYPYITAITLTNELYVWGCYKPISMFQSLVNVIYYTCPQMQLTPLKMELPAIKEIVYGIKFTLALTVSGELYSWGYGKKGQLGFGNFYDQQTPQKIPLPSIRKVIASDFSSFAITKSDELYCWGQNTGQLGLGHYNNVNSPKKAMEDVFDIYSVSDIVIVTTKFSEIYWTGNFMKGYMADHISNVFKKIDLLSNI
jgi:alpha-tubulin suppressor-like RCC1 family protein